MTSPNDVSTKSCLNCKHYLDQDSPRQRAVLGKPVEASVCMSRGLVIGTNLLAPRALAKRCGEMADMCKKYQEIHADHREHYPSGGIAEYKKVFNVGISANDELPKPEVVQGPTKTCKSCFFFVSPRVMFDTHKIAAGTCSKFGNIIPENNAGAQAASCNSSQRVVLDGVDVNDHYRKLAESLHLDPMLKKYLFAGLDDALSASDRVDPMVDPNTYTSDRPVTAQQSASGIRAWRRMKSGDRELFMPIFRHDYFSPEEQAKIPRPGDDEHCEKYNDHMNLAFRVAVLWFKLDETPALHGKAGTGKTEFFRYMAYLMQLPFERISITGDTQIDDLVGSMHLRKSVNPDGTTSGYTEFVPGRVPDAWAKPCVVCIDEPNTGQPDVWQFLRPLTDNSKVLVLDRGDGNVVHRSPFTFMGMAMNPAWDPRNVGAQVIGDADGSRLMHIFVDLPSEDIERSIIQERCNLDGYEIGEDTLNIIMDAAKQIRALSDANELPITWGIRNQVKVARATAWFPVQQSYKLAVLDYLEPQIAEVVSSLVDDAETAVIKGRRGK